MQINLRNQLNIKLNFSYIFILSPNLPILRQSITFSSSQHSFFIFSFPLSCFSVLRILLSHHHLPLPPHLQLQLQSSSLPLHPTNLPTCPPRPFLQTIPSTFIPHHIHTSPSPNLPASQLPSSTHSAKQTLPIQSDSPRLPANIRPRLIIEPIF